MDEEQRHAFNKFWKDLDDGYQIYFKYMDVKYLIYKITKNCYKQEFVKSYNEKNKNPHHKTQTITLKRVQELFPFMEDMEYKIGISEN